MDNAPPIAWRPLALVSGAVFAVLFGLSGGYGYHRDELYYLAAGQHLAWGYDDQPPVVVLLARLADEVSGGALMVLRLPATLAVAATALLTGLIARELGGGAKAQTVAAVAMGCAPILLLSGHLLSTTVLDIFFWTLVAFLLVRYLRAPHDRLLYLAGPVIGLALLTKTLIIVFLAAVFAGLLIAGPRDVFKRPALYVAAAVALAMWAPNLWWQAQHGWPQLEMTAVIREDADWGGQAFVAPTQLLIMGPALAPIWIAGLVRLFRSPELRPLRAFGIAYPIVLVTVIVTGGRMYYVAGAYAVLVAAGSLALVWWLKNRWGLYLSVAFTVLFTAVMGLPIFPIDRLADTPQPALHYDAGETVGWPKLTATVAHVYSGLTEAERRTAVILTSNYGQAGAITRFGPAHGLPRPYSGHLAFWRWGPPPDTATGPVIVVSEQPPTFCETATVSARNDNGYRVDNEEQGVPIWLCRGLKQPWHTVWPGLRRL
ncbi:MAG TPA: glycosyltransferase family 39 protein [Candidatus Limnocylindrales bacterium]